MLLSSWQALQKFAQGYLLVFAYSGQKRRRKAAPEADEGNKRTTHPRCFVLDETDEACKKNSLQRVQTRCKDVAIIRVIAQGVTISEWPLAAAQTKNAKFLKRTMKVFSISLLKIVNNLEMTPNSGAECPQTPCDLIIMAGTYSL